MSIDLKQKIEAWIRAEYIFRVTDRNYTQEAQDWLLQAEDELRQSVTGLTGLSEAGNSLGCKPNTGLKRSIPKQRQKLQQAVKAKTTFKKKGLF